MSCPQATLSANNDYEAVRAWLALHESAATQRAYRKEAERLILWATIERGRAVFIDDRRRRCLSSLLASPAPDRNSPAAASLGSGVRFHWPGQHERAALEALRRIIEVRVWRLDREQMCELHGDLSCGPESRVLSVASLVPAILLPVFRLGAAKCRGHGRRRGHLS